MRRIPSVLAALAMAALVSTAVPAPARAASADPTYHGIFEYGAFSDGACAGLPVDQLPVAGNWNVTLQPDGTAVVHTTVFVLDRLLVAWGGNALHPLARSDAPGLEIHTAFIQVTPGSGEVFSLATPLEPIGSNLTVVLTDDHVLTFTFTPYFGCEWHKVVGVER